MEKQAARDDAVLESKQILAKMRQRLSEKLAPEIVNTEIYISPHEDISRSTLGICPTP